MVRQGTLHLSLVGYCSAKALKSAWSHERELYLQGKPLSTPNLTRCGAKADRPLMLRNMTPVFQGRLDFGGRGVPDAP